MAKSLDYIKDEIIRVSNLLGLDPRSLRRSDFLKQTSVTKHDIEVSGIGFSKLRVDAAHTYGIPSKINLGIQRGVDLRNNYVRSLERAKGSQEYLSKKLLDGLNSIFVNNPIVVPKSTVAPVPNKDIEKTLTLLWSDLHFGVKVDSRETYESQFDWTIASRRLALTCLEAINWDPEDSGETELQIILNGDIIHGVVHLTEANLVPLQEQIWCSTAILSKAIGFLSQYFGSISVLCLPGNHDRVVYRSRERALSQRWDSHSHSIYMGLKIWFKDFENVDISIPMSGLGTYLTAGGHRVIASHGDVEPSTSNPAKSFNVEKTTQSIMKLNSGNIFDSNVDVVLYGHWHSPSMFMLTNGSYCIVNGSLLGTDPFAQNALGVFNCVPAQVLFESTGSHPVNKFKVCTLSYADDNEYLDEIIDIPELNDGGLIDF